MNVSRLCLGYYYYYYLFYFFVVFKCVMTDLEGDQSLYHSQKQIDLPSETTKM